MIPGCCFAQGHTCQFTVKAAGFYSLNRCAQDCLCAKVFSVMLANLTADVLSELMGWNQGWLAYSSPDWTVSKVASLGLWIPGGRSIASSYSFVKDPAGPINPQRRRDLIRPFPSRAERGHRLFQKRKRSFPCPVTATDSLTFQVRDPGTN